MGDIRLDSYHLQSSRAGLYCGRLSQEGLMERSLKQMERMWGHDRPVLHVPPEEGKDYRLCMAWLSGPAREMGDDGTHLFVIWYTPEGEEPSDPLVAAMSHVEANGGWEKLSVGWGF